MQVQGREKIVGVILLACVGIFLLVLLVQGTILKPAKDLKNKRTQLTVKLNKLKKDQEQFKIAEKEVLAAGKKMVCANTDQANGVMGELLNSFIQKVELNPREFTRSPVGPSRVGRGGAREVGWTVQGEGPLSKVVDLLYLLENVSVFHRVESLRFSASSQPGWVRVGFRYLTLVVEPTPTSVGTNTMDTITVADLATPERQLYEGIVARDIFRPYVKKPVGVKDVASEGGASDGSQEPPAFRPEIWKVISLSEWNGKSEIHVQNTESGEIQVYQPGDTVEGWTLLMVDYRRMPKADSILYSESRVILQNKEGYWALDKGSSFAQLYPMKEEELPSSIKTEDNLKDNDN